MLGSVTGSAIAAKDRLMISRLTPNSNQPVDGTQLHEIQVAVCESVNRSVSIANILIDRLSKENPYIKWKHLAETCNETFAYDILKHSDKLREVATYTGPPDPINGMVPYELLHQQAVKTSNAIMNRVNQGPSRPANATFQSTLPTEAEAESTKPRSNSLFSHKKQMVGLGNNLSTKDIRHDEWMDKVKNLGHSYTPESNVNENMTSASSVTASLTLEGSENKKKSWVEKAKSLVGPSGKPRAQSVVVGEVSLSADTTPGFLTRAKMAMKGRTTSSEKIVGVGNTNYKPTQPEWMNKANVLGKPRSMTYDATVSNDFDTMYNPTASSGGYQAPVTSIDNYMVNNKKAVQKKEVQEVSFGEKFKAVSGKALSDGSYEKSLVDDLVSSGGLKPSPPPAKLQQFCSDCLTLDPNIIGEVLLDKLNDNNYMVVVKTLSVIEALIKNPSTNDYVVFFITNVELIEDCLSNPKVIVSSKAQRVLQELNKRNEELGGVEYEVVEEVIEEEEAQTPREKVGLESVSELAENEENDVQTPKDNDLDDLFNTIPSAPSNNSNSLNLDVDPFGAFSVLTPLQQFQQQQQHPQQQQQQISYGMNLNNNYNMNRNIPASSKGMKPPKRGPY